MPVESLIDLLAIDPPPKAEQPVNMTIKLIRNINLKNEDLISDIEGLAHHLVVEKGSTQLFEFITIDSSEGNRDESFDKAVYKLIKNKYPHLLVNHHQKSFKY